MGQIIRARQRVVDGATAGNNAPTAATDGLSLGQHAAGHYVDWVQISSVCAGAGGSYNYTVHIWDGTRWIEDTRLGAGGVVANSTAAPDSQSQWLEVLGMERVYVEVDTFAGGGIATVDVALVDSRG